MLSHRPVVGIKRADVPKDLRAKLLTQGPTATSSHDCHHYCDRAYIMLRKEHVGHLSFKGYLSQIKDTERENRRAPLC